MLRPESSPALGLTRTVRPPGAPPPALSPAPTSAQPLSRPLGRPLAPFSPLLLRLRPLRAALILLVTLTFASMLFRFWLAEEFALRVVVSV